MNKRKFLKTKQKELREFSGRVVRLIALNQNNNEVFRNRKHFLDKIVKIDDKSIYLSNNNKKGYDSILYISDVGRDYEVEEVAVYTREMKLSNITKAEDAIKNRLKKEHILLGLTPKISLLCSGEITNIIFYQNYSKESKKMFAKFNIEDTNSNGYLCANRTSDHNVGLPVEHSLLLQDLLRTIVEDALDDVFYGEVE